jgi:hypothetical protein
MIRALRSPALAAIRTLAGLGFASLALAQSPEPAPAPAEASWVQYELIAFRPVEPMASDETWPVEALPGYPPQIGFLLEPGSPAHEAALRAREFDLSLQGEAGTAAQPVDPLGAELPRLRLSGVDTVLAPVADRIGNSREYRLLGHYAWRQPLPAAGQAEHLLITGGAASGDHFELEGYITLSRSRFLHVDTTLWLNELLPPGSPAPEGSVELPALPKPQLPEQEPLLPEAAPPLDPAAAEPGLAGVPTNTEPAALMVEAQHARSSIVLRASRRLAGNTAYYIDHPRLGLILSARPWDPAAPPPAPAEESPASAPSAPAPAPAPAPARTTP